MNKLRATRQSILQGGGGGTPTADSRFAVPRPSGRNALRNPPRQYVLTVRLSKKPLSLKELFG